MIVDFLVLAKCLFFGSIFIRYELLVHKYKEGYFMLGRNILFAQNKQNGGGIFTTK